MSHACLDLDCMSDSDHACCGGPTCTLCNPPAPKRVVLAIVGSTQLAGNQHALAIIENVLDRYKPDLVVSGEAKGIDSMAKAAALRRGIAYQGYPPAVKTWDRGFKPRNMLIAQHCTHLVRIASAKAKTYGSGWTRDYAAKIGKFTEEFVI
jgi:hypothetical protein